jgi:6-phosphogluconolactonase (cycloisomerase 2 family)
MNQSPGVVYAQSNEPEANKLLVFERAPDGTLSPSGAHETGGGGDGIPHLTSQGSVMLTASGRHLLVTNAGSGDVSLFAIGESAPVLLQTIRTGGAPKSIAQHGELVYVLNTAPPSLSGFRLSAGQLARIPETDRELPANSDPAQAGFAPDGSTLVLTDRATNTLILYPVEASGVLGEPQLQPSSGPTPYGFAFTSRSTLIVTEAFGAAKGAAAASSYAIAGTSATPISRSVGNGRSEICWAVVTPDDRYAFTTNFADGAVSRYAIGADGSLTLDDATAGVAVLGQTGLRDEVLSSDGRFLYALDADSNRIFGWAVDDDGALGPLGSWDGLPATVAGLAAS